MKKPKSGELSERMDAGHAPTMTPDSAGAPGGFLPKGTVIGSYRVENFIDAGGMGSVYRCLHTTLKNVVAIKGSALTEKQVELLRRICDRIV